MDDDRTKQRWSFRVIVFFSLLPRITSFQDCPSTVVGVADSNIIPDSSFTATSFYDGRYTAVKARFNSDKGWGPKTTTDPNDYLQIDLGKVFVICGVATKGTTDEWTTKYKISTSLDGTTYTWYPDNNPKMFTGNADSDTAVKHILGVPVKAKLIRFTPIQYNSFKVLRVELYGVNLKAFQDCPSTVVGVADRNIIPDSSFTATSIYNSKYAAVKARFNSDKAWAPRTNAKADDYLQIDLVKVFVICGVATKGAKDVDEWTKEYKISTSLDGITYTWYPDNNAKVFTGNTDRDTAVTHALGVPVKAGIIRFTPTDYNGFKALRVELYGVDFRFQSWPIGISNVTKIPNSRMMSSSEYNASTEASHGRLGYTAGSSWCSATLDSSPYLQISLTGSYVILGVATQGDHMSKQWVQTYQVQTSSDGTSFTDYQENYVTKEFSGNIDSNTIAQSPLYDGLVGQYIRITPKSRFGSTSCMRTELYGENKNTVCANIPIGIRHASLVPNHRFTASSYYNNDKNYLPSEVRLRNTLSWVPTNQDVDPWVQIDLGSVMYMCAVSTQGNPNHNEFVKTYKLRMSVDNMKWEFYKETNTEKVFKGNADRNSIVKNTLVVPARVKFLRFYPKDFNSYTSLRVEVYGLPSACSMPFGLEKNGSKGSIGVMSSSDLDNAHDTSHARLYGDASWCSNTSSASEYIQIDFGQMVTLTGIATQGDHTMEKWVKTYTIKYSIDGNLWNEYREGGGSAKVFQGNTDNSSIVVRWLKHPTTVRYIKVNPKTWNTDICLRLELFGCPYASKVKISELSNQNLQPSRGRHVTLTCKVDEPLVKYIEWIYDGTDVTNLSGGITRAATFVKSTLQVNYTSADDIFNADSCSKTALNVTCRRSIVCKAMYTKGSGTALSIQGAQIKIELDHPHVPSLQSFSNVLTTSVEVRWTVPAAKESQLSINDFNIKYWNSETTKSITVPNSPTSSHSITGLLVCTYYNVTVRAVSQLGEGPWSSIQSFRTASELPKAPSQVTAKAQTSTSVDVSWTVPSGIRCPPDGYKITFSTTPGGSEGQYVVNNAQTLSHTLPNLSKWTNYYIKVQIHNEKGYGPSNTALKERTLEDVPDAAPESFQGLVRSSTSISLTWGLPLENKRNGVIRGFKILYCKVADCSTPTTKDLSGNSTLKDDFDGLEMYTEYSFKILAYTSKGDGPYTNYIKTRTYEGAPSAPRNIKTEPIVPDAAGPKLRLTWDRPLHFHAEYIRKYIISYKKSGDFQATSHSLKDNSTTASFDVCGGVNYDISVWAFTVADGPKIATTVTTEIYAPNKPTNLKSDEHNTSTFNISWQPLPSTNGPILTYEFSSSRLDTPSNELNKQCMINVSCPQVACRSSARHRCTHVLHDLPQCAKYELTVRAYTAKGPGDFSDAFNLETSVPGPPRDPKVQDVGKDGVKLTWSEPYAPVKSVQKYTIKYSGEKDYKFEWVGVSAKGTEISKTTSVTITGLIPATTYSFTISATTECSDLGKDSEIAIARTEAGAPPAPTTGTISTINGSVTNITLWKISAINGPISQILVYAKDVEGGNKTRRSTGPANPDCKAIANESFNLDANQIVFTLGDGNDYGGKKNEELNEGKMYKVYQCGVTRNNQKLLYGETAMIASGRIQMKEGKSAQESKSSTPLVASLAAGAVLLIVVIVGVVFWKCRLSRRNNPHEKEIMKLRYFSNNEETDIYENEIGEVSASARNAGYTQNENENKDSADVYENAEAMRYQPIRVNKFNHYVNEKGDTALKDEFKLFTSMQLYPWTVAKDPKNGPRNRFANIIPYDRSRVVLQDTINGSDYINASYIHGFDGTPKAYIATQGPKTLIVPEFWQMVWQENVNTIVMLTNLLEAKQVKCNQYWPDQKETYGKFTVTLYRFDTLADYVVRVLILCKDGESDSRQVHHFQYTSWPDKGVPQHATSVLGLRRKARSHCTSCRSTAPLLVHCSAGVGRTGAFIAIDAMLERVKKDKTIDILNYVQLMRENRSKIIHTEDQYVFIHRAVLEAVTCGNTEIPVTNLKVAMEKMGKRRLKDRQTGYALEWKSLAAISPKVTDEVTKAGQQHNNKPRNRYQDIMPLDSARVIISQENQDYINASFANDFREHNAFIMTQAPMENTVSDFWYMIHQYKIGCIVMLNKLQEKNELFLQYLPASGSESYHDITVQVMNVSKNGRLVISKCVVTCASDPKPHTFVHIQHTDWPKDGVPSNCQSVLDLVDRVQKAQQQSCSTPIVVQCSDGVGRSGSFCAIYSTLERVKSEQVVDVFQAIKVLRLGRPNAVSTLEQYKFCYKMVQVYLDSFNDYANFSEV